jgi:hypothetical protein
LQTKAQQILSSSIRRNIFFHLPLWRIPNHSGYLIAVQLAQSYEVGIVRRTPIPELNNSVVVALFPLAFSAWSFKRALDTTNETSHAYLLPPGLNERITGLDPPAIEQELARIQQEIDDRAFALYGIGAEDRATIEAASRRGAAAIGANTEEADEAVDTDADAGEDDASDDDAAAAIAQTDALLSWCLGVALGRFDIRLATAARNLAPVGEMREPAPEPEPFDPLPTRSPGMWPEHEPRVTPPPSILVDDPHHRHGLTATVSQVLAMVGSSDPDGLCRWLAKEFLSAPHQDVFQEPAQAPIYWQLATQGLAKEAALHLGSDGRGQVRLGASGHAPALPLPCARWRHEGSPDPEDRRRLPGARSKVAPDA